MKVNNLQETSESVICATKHLLAKLNLVEIINLYLNEHWIIFFMIKLLFCLHQVFYLNCSTYDIYFTVAVKIKFYFLLFHVTFGYKFYSHDIPLLDYWLWTAQFQSSPIEKEKIGGVYKQMLYTSKCKATSNCIEMLYNLLV